jgi:hypothetical protein
MPFGLAGVFIGVFWPSIIVTPQNKIPENVAFSGIFVWWD